MTFTNDSKFYKKIDLFVYSCTILTEIAEEDKKIFNILIKACDHFGKVNSQLISNEFGFRLVL